MISDKIFMCTLNILAIVTCLTVLYKNYKVLDRTNIIFLLAATFLNTISLLINGGSIQ